MVQTGKRMFVKVIEKFADLLYRLFFTRNDDLDVLQVLFAGIVLTTLFITWKLATTSGVESVVIIEALITLRWLTGLLVVTAVPKWLVPAVSGRVTALLGKKDDVE